MTTQSQGLPTLSSPDDVAVTTPEADKPVVAPRTSKVAILGFAGSTLEHAPIDDDSWEVWGLNQLWMRVPRYDKWFDLHPKWYTDTDDRQLAWLKDQTKPILMQQHYATIPASVAYPKDEIMQVFGSYFTSSIAWMIALAIAQRYPTIGIWGVDMLADSEYAFQRACCDYYIGLARGAGIDVVLPRDCALARGQGLYGYDYTEPFVDRRIQRINRRRNDLERRKNDTLQQVYLHDGALLEAQEWLHGNHDDAWKGQRLAELNEKKEAHVRTLYTIDGALQENGSNLLYEKHYRRGGA